MPEALEVEFKFREVARTTAIAWLGALLEWVDFYTYALLAGIVAGHFFPKWDPIAALLASFAALAIGFLFRPLGALLFGRIGDIYGRKIAFVLAALCMLAGTLGIGLLPTYAQIGALASIAVFVLRIIQGLALGGGFGAAIVYLGESVPEKRRGFYTGFLFTTAPLGIAVVAGMIGIISSTFGEEALKTWAWRLPFIIAGLIVVIVAIVLHLFYKETPVFSMLKRIRRVTSAPIRELFADPRHRFLVLLAWIGVIGAHGPIWYTNQLISKYYMVWHGISEGTASTILSICTLAAAWAYIAFGALSDKIGRRIILLIGIYLNALLFIPVFWLMREACLAENIAMLWGLTYILTFMNGLGYSGAMSAYLLELFPARIRLTATAFVYNMGYGITGGLTPLIITTIYKFIGDWWTSVIAWSTVVPMLMGLLFVLKGWETRGTRIWEEFSAGKFARDGIVVKPETSIVDACKMLVEKGDRAVIVNYGNKNVGVVGERAILRAVGNATNVGDIAVKLECIDERTPLPIVLAAMEEYNITVVPICSNSRIRVIDQRELLAESLGLEILASKKIAERYKLEEVGNKPITIEATAKLRDAIKIIVEKDIGLLPVTSNGKLVAVFSEKDAIRAIAENADLDTQVIEYATKDPKVVKCSSTIKEAINLMLSLNVRHVVGVDDNGYPKCIASVKDLLKIA